MTASTPAWRFDRGQSQAVIAGNDAAHGRSRYPHISGDLFGFARVHQGVVNHPPAFSNPRAWIQFHATFDFFYWIMCCGSGDSRSHNRSSSLLSSVSPLYHTERKLVLILMFEVSMNSGEDQVSAWIRKLTKRSSYDESARKGQALAPVRKRSASP